MDAHRRRSASNKSRKAAEYSIWAAVPVVMSMHLHSWLDHRTGFADPRLVEDRPLEITAPELAEKTAGLRFFSATYRLFKLEQLETACEDYGQAVIYRGTF